MNKETSEQSLELFRLVAENVRDFAVYAKDLEGHILSWNPGVERLLGYEEAEWVGRHISIIFTPEDLAQGGLDWELKTALEQGRAEDKRWHVRKDGSRFWANGLLMLLRDGAGEPRGFAKILRDDTARKRAEDELRRSRDELERRVAERTVELRAEVEDRRAAEGRVKELLHRIIEAQEFERRRIARDLHDQLGQQLTALRLNLELLKTGGAGRQGLPEAFDRAEKIVQGIEAEVDFIAWELRPAALDHLGLSKALESFVREWAAHYGIPFEFRAGVEGRLKPEVEINLYRIAQEALNNVMKHAGASRVDVVLDRRDEEVVLIVEDDGKGFTPERAIDGEKGMGLLSIKERAAQVGGTLEIETGPGAGTTVYVRVPAVEGDAGSAFAPS
jgi:PAS domain S-box-containing protein